MNGLNERYDLNSDELLIKINGNRIASDDINDFIQNSIGFTKKNSISIDGVMKIELTGIGNVQFLKSEDNIYKIRVIESDEVNENKNSLNSYILIGSELNMKNKYPSYVDIPKVADDIKFLFSSKLTGNSIIVTELNSNTYRVYNDSRINSSILYDNIVMAIDYNDYKLTDCSDSIATVYMQYINESWQLILQKQKNELRDGVLISILRNKNNPIEVYYPDINVSFYKKQKFLEYRDKLHFEILNLADYLSMDTSYLRHDVTGNLSIDNMNENSWVKVMIEIKRRIRTNIKFIDYSIKKWEGRLKYLNSLENYREGEKKEVLFWDKRIKQSEKLIDFHRNQYKSLLLDAKAAEYSWLWYQLKEKKGMREVVSEPVRNRVERESNLSINERYRNLIHIHKNSINIKFISDFNAGVERFNEIKIEGVEGGMTSIQLKEIYLNANLKPLERGALYHQIINSEKNEYIKNVLMKTKEVSDIFSLSESQNNRLAPQDLYLSLVGDDSNGRCYPLVRAMSVALANRGQQGANTLIDRLFLAAANPNEKDSILLKTGFVKLHSNISAVEASISNGVMDLKDIQKLLSSKKQTVMFAMNTQSHSMLIGKTVMHGKITYYFYDPNFGLFKFENIENFFSSINKFMIDKNMALYYDALGTENNPVFTIITVVTDDMAIVPIGNNLNVSNLSEPGALSLVSDHQEEISQLIERQDILNTDIQLKTSLVILDAQQWGDALDKSTKLLSSEYNLGKEWIPIFSSVEKISNNRYRIQCVNNENTDLTRWVETSDSLLIKFRHYYENNMKTFEQYYYIEGDEIKPKGEDIEIVPIDSLNAGVAIQSLIQWVSNRSHHEHENTENPTNLLLALKIHTYVNYTMMVHGSINDAIKTTKLIQSILKNDNEITITEIDGFSSSLARTANEGIGIIFNSILIGFDIYELTHSTDEFEEVVFGTQLTFDSAGLIVEAGSFTAGTLGDSSVSVAFGGAGVLLAGLGIGFTGLSHNFAIIGKDAKSVGHYFYLLDQAYQGNGYDHLKDKSVLSPRFGAIFKTIDLKNNQIEFDSQYIYRTSPASAGGGRKNYIAWAGNFPTLVHDRNLAINIRNGIGYEKNKHELKFSNLDVLILPVTPKSYIKYDYNLFPGATTRHDTGFDVLRRLEKGDNFDYDFYIFPSENIITEIEHEYVNTEVEIKLDANKRFLVVPNLSSTWYGYMNYTVKGDGGEYQISLQHGVSFKLSDDSGNGQSSRWIIDSRQLDKKEIAVFKDWVDIGGIKVEIDSSIDKSQVFIVGEKKEIREVNFNSLTTSVISEDNSKWSEGIKTLKSHLEKISSEDEYIIVDNFINYNRNVGRAYYDVKKERFIFINTTAEINKDIILGSVIDEVACFYSLHDNFVYKVDVNSGNVIVEYYLKNQDKQPFNVIQVWQGSGNTYVSCGYIYYGKMAIASYYINNNEIVLLSISSDIDLLKKLSDKKIKISNQESKDLFDKYKLEVDIYSDDQYLSNSSLAEIIMIKGGDEKGYEHSYWFRERDGLLIKPNIPSRFNQSNEKNRSVSDLKDLMFLGVLNDESNNEVFYFYSKNNEAIYRQEIHSNDPELLQASCIEIPNLKNIFYGKNILILKGNGVICKIKPDGYIDIIAVNESWFSLHPNWWDSLNSEFIESSIITLYGIKSSNGKDMIPAWYANGKVIISSELSSTNKLKVLGMSESNAELIVFDTNTQKLYSQKFSTEDELAIAFGQSHQITESSVLPSITELYPNTKIKEIKKIASGILLITQDDKYIYHGISSDQSVKSSGYYIGSSLIVQGSKEDDLFIPSVITDAKSLVISGGDGIDNYVLTELVWLKYEAIVIDNYSSDFLVDTIVLPVENRDSLFVNQHGEDLVLTDTHANTILILRQVFGSQAKEHQHLQVSFLNEPRPYTIEELVEHASSNYKLASDAKLRKTDIFSSGYNGNFNGGNIDALVGAIAPFDGDKNQLANGGIDSEIYKSFAKDSTLIYTKQ